MYIPILYVTKMTQNKNDLINSCYYNYYNNDLINSCYNNYCVLFSTLRFPYLICVPESGNGR